jgi:dTDP-4-amino-4,6-dideoxygalactose transaminase
MREINHLSEDVHMAEMKVKFVDLGLEYKSLKDEILKKFDELSSQGQYILGSEVENFEKSFAKFCGTKHAIGVANGTDALFLSMKALGIGHGDEVITAANSFIASAASIAQLGATPVFVDVRDDYNMDPALLEKAITKKTKAIMPVHLTGRPADIDAIMAIAKKHKLFVVEDSAQAVGAKYRGKRVGSFGNTGCFSLHPLKNLHVHGDGGAIVTNDTALYEILIKMRNHGLKNRDECEFFAINSRLDSIHAGILNIKLPHLDKWNARYWEIAKKYQEGLSGLKGFVQVPVDKSFEEPVYHRFIIQCEKRDELQKYLLEKGIDTKVHYPIPLHLQKAAGYLGYKEGDFPVSEKQAKKILSLPCYPALKDEQVELVIKEINAFYGKKKINNK